MTSRLFISRLRAMPQRRTLPSMVLGSGKRRSGFAPPTRAGLKGVEMLRLAVLVVFSMTAPVTAQERLIYEMDGIEVIHDPVSQFCWTDVGVTMENGDRYALSLGLSVGRPTLHFSMLAPAFKALNKSDAGSLVLDFVHSDYSSITSYGKVGFDVLSDERGARLEKVFSEGEYVFDILRSLESDELISIANNAAGDSLDMFPLAEVREQVRVLKECGFDSVGLQTDDRTRQYPSAIAYEESISLLGGRDASGSKAKVDLLENWLLAHGALSDENLIRASTAIGAMLDGGAVTETEMNGLCSVLPNCRKEMRVGLGLDERELNSWIRSGDLEASSAINAMFAIVDVRYSAVRRKLTAE